MNEILKKIKLAMRSIPPLSLVYIIIGCALAFFLPIPYISMYIALLLPLVWTFCLCRLVFILKPKCFFRNSGYALWRSLLILIAACGALCIALVPFGVAMTAFVINQQGIYMGDPDNMPQHAMTLICITIVLSLCLSYAIAHLTGRRMKTLVKKIQERELGKSKLNKIIND